MSENSNRAFETLHDHHISPHTTNNNSVQIISPITSNHSTNASPSNANNTMAQQQQQPATFSSTTPYIIQNGKIYQLTSNNQLIARNLIHINQLSSLVSTENGVQQQIDDSGTGLKISNANSTIKNSSILNLNTSNGRIVIKAPEPSQQISFTNGGSNSSSCSIQQQQNIKPVNKQVIISNNSNMQLKAAVATAPILSKKTQVQQQQQQQQTLLNQFKAPANSGNNLQQKIFMPITTVNGSSSGKNVAITISNNKLQSLLSGGHLIQANLGDQQQKQQQQQAQQHQHLDGSSLQILLQQQSNQNDLNDTGKICDLTKQINLNKSISNNDNLMNILNNSSNLIGQQQQQMHFKLEQVQEKSQVQYEIGAGAQNQMANLEKEIQNLMQSPQPQQVQHQQQQQPTSAPPSKQQINAQFSQTINAIKSNLNYNSKLIANSMQPQSGQSSSSKIQKEVAFITPIASSKPNTQQMQQNANLNSQVVNQTNNLILAMQNSSYDLLANKEQIAKIPTGPKKLVDIQPNTGQVKQQAQIIASSVKNNQQQMNKLVQSPQLISQQLPVAQMPQQVVAHEIENNENFLNEKLLNQALLPDTRIFASLLNKDQNKVGNEGTINTGNKKQNDMNLKFKTALIGNREHIILDNLNNLSDFRGNFGELKHLASSVADHLHKPVTIPAFLVVEDLEAVERIKQILGENNINPLVINTPPPPQQQQQQQVETNDKSLNQFNQEQANANTLADQQTSSTKPNANDDAHILNRQQFNQQQHPYLIQTLSSSNKKQQNSESSPNHRVISSEVKEKAKKQRATPRPKKSAQVNLASAVVSQETHAASAAPVGKQPSQTCAEILSKSNLDNSFGNSSGGGGGAGNNSFQAISKLNSPLVSGTSMTAVLNNANLSKSDQKKPRIQKINEILMTNNTQMVQVTNMQPIQSNSNSNLTMEPVYIQQQQMEHQIQQAVDTFNSMDHHNHELNSMHQFLESNESSSQDIRGNENNDNNNTNTNNILSFINENNINGSMHNSNNNNLSQSETSQFNANLHQMDMISHQSNDFLIKQEQEKYMPHHMDSSNFMCTDLNGHGIFDDGNQSQHQQPVNVNNNNSNANSNNNANDYSFNFDPFDSNVLFSTNLNDLEV